MTELMFMSSVAPAIEETLAKDYDYQVFVSISALKLNGSSGTLKVCGLKADDDGTVYKYQKTTKDLYDALTDVTVAQTDESVFAFARANLAEGNLNTAKHALVSTFDATLIKRHAKALTNAEVTKFARSINSAIFNKSVLKNHEILNSVKVNDKISLLELIKIFEAHKSSIIINLKHLQSNYQRKGLKRIKGYRDNNGDLVKPWLKTEYSDSSEYVAMGAFEINRNTATINMLITRKIKLVRAEENQIMEMAGILVNDLNTYNNYTIVSDGELNVKSLKVKISSKKVFDLLKAQGVLENDNTIVAFDFRAEYIIRLDNLPIVPIKGCYSSIDGVENELAEIQVLSSILSAHLKQESDVYIPEQLEELKKHYLSKSLYINFPTTNEYTDIKESIANGTVDSRVSYRIDIGSKDILNLGKLYSANKFLGRMYEAYNKVTGEIFQAKPTFEMALDENIAFRHKELSSRMKITKVDDFMKPIFNDFIGIEKNGIVAAILSKVGADSLLHVLQDKWNSKTVSREEFVTALVTAKDNLEQYAERIYREKICPLVFYIGSTGLLPDEMESIAQTAEEIGSKYVNLQFSKDEQEGMFFEVGDSIISVYAKNKYYSKNELISLDYAVA